MKVYVFIEFSNVLKTVNCIRKEKIEKIEYQINALCALCFYLINKRLTLSAGIFLEDIVIQLLLFNCIYNVYLFENRNWSTSHKIDTTNGKKINNLQWITARTMLVTQRNHSCKRNENNQEKLARIKQFLERKTQKNYVPFYSSVFCFRYFVFLFFIFSFRLFSR